MGLESGTNKLIAVSQTSRSSEMFDIVRNPNDSRKIRIKASNGKFLQVKSETLVTVDYNEDESWQEDNPSVFNFAIKNYIEDALTANCTLSPTEIEDYDSEDISLAANLALLAKPSLRTFKSLLSEDLESLLKKHQKKLLLTLAAALSKSSELSDKQRSFLSSFPPRNLPASVLL
ncbi:hypothetical protein CFOL_v3_28738 [Cephalotus follicularis]|uniref:DUF7910 domain-containing protein n=1 Tax=Cephalotus follicularis TaxID=3775 RepID=A0A1Q3CYI2_CEPFO|nr:hypothetical protein CFOL_v3_28738 [Cephalotus follicularis]